MSKLTKLLNKRVIRKKVDEGMGDTPSTRIPEVQAQYAETETTVQSLTDDLIAAADSVLALTMDTIKELEIEFKDHEIFTLLAKELRVRAIDPSLLDSDPNYEPQYAIPQTVLLAAQRQVFEEINSPRAPFIWDLWNIAQELTTLVWSLRRGWNSLEEAYTRLFGAKGNSNTFPTKSDSRSKLKHGIKPTKSMKRAHFLNMERVKYLKFETERIKHKQHQTIPESLLQSLAYALEDYASLSGGQSRDAMLRMMTMLLEDQLLELSDDHQRFLTLANEHYGSWTDFATRQVTNHLSHSVLSMAMDQVVEFTLLLEQVADRQDPYVLDFRKRLEGGLFNHTLQVEEDMIDKEERSVDQARNLMHLNVETTGLVKQYILALRGAENLDRATGPDGIAVTVRNMKSAAQTFHTSSISRFLSVLDNVKKILEAFNIR